MRGRHGGNILSATDIGERHHQHATVAPPLQGTVALFLHVARRAQLSYVLVTMPCKHGLSTPSRIWPLRCDAEPRSPASVNGQSLNTRKLGGSREAFASPGAPRNLPRSSQLEIQCALASEDVELGLQDETVQLSPVHPISEPHLPVVQNRRFANAQAHEREGGVNGCG